MNILFVCKYNRFRSRIAEAYFKKINKNTSIKTMGGGIIVGSYPLDKEEIKIAKELGIELKGKPQPITSKKIRYTDKIIIVANNVPPKIFSNFKKYGKEIIVWKIKDITSNEPEKNIRKIIKKIIKKVDKLSILLNKSMEKEK